MKTICLSSLKGGTGKSSITIALTNALAVAGYTVLVIDMDLNNSCSFYYLDETDVTGIKNIAAALQGTDLKNHTQPSNVPNVDILQSSLYLVDLRTVPQNRLRRLLPTLEGVYDYVLIDTSPTYDNLVLCAMEAADIILTPVLMTQFDFNTSNFLDGKLKTETDFYDRWHLVYNGYDKRFDEFNTSTQKDYRALFESSFTNFAPLDCCLPWTAQVRRYVDRREKINPARHPKLHAAVANLAAYVAGTKIKAKGEF
jgi:chromosome partitioning protein